jgi:hypothetical protein
VGAAPWFSSVGDWRESVVGPLLLRSDEGWPGPEDPRCEALALLGQEHFDVVTADSPHLERLFDKVMATVREEAAPWSDGYDPEEDPWYAPTARVWDAAGWAAAMVAYAASGQGVHPDVWELWLWFEAGHWPCGLAVRAPALQHLMIM